MFVCLFVFVYFDRSELRLSDETIRIKYFLFSRKLRWKYFWNLPKWLRCRKASSFQTIKDSLEDQDKLSNSVMFVLNDSAGPKVVIKLHFNFFRSFLKVLKLSECRRGDPLMTANKNFIPFAHTYLIDLTNPKLFWASKKKY